MQPQVQQLQQVNNILQSWGEMIVSALAEALPRDKDTTGELRESIQFTFTRMGFPITFQLSLLDYYQWVDQGRKPGGKFPPIDVIRQWIINKRLVINTVGRLQQLHATMPMKGNKPRITKGQTVIADDEKLLKSLTFLFSRKIARDGIEPTNFYSNTVTNNSLAQLKDNISKAFRQDVMVQIINIKDQLSK